MTVRMYRYEIRVDDREQTLRLKGEIRHVALKPDTIDLVEIWAEHDYLTPESVRTFRVFGTGHEIPPGLTYVGTTGRAYGYPSGFVWHLYERK
jgi:hypothetical protein